MGYPVVPMRSPVAPLVPRESAYPGRGWHLERETHIEQDGGGYRYTALSGMWRRQPDTFTLTVRVPYEPGTPPPHLGDTLRNLLATDSAGREYRVPTASLTRHERTATMNPYRQNEVTLIAVASSTPVPI